MGKEKVDRTKFKAQKGRMPVLQFLPPAELKIDLTYQRSIEAAESQVLIRKIAQRWNWDLCQPLVVSRRRGDQGDQYFVIDGQHRLEAAKLRGDIGQLPCVVVEYVNAADEAANFVHLNQVRRPLSRLQIFKAAVASGDKRACRIVDALTEFGLSVATQTNWNFWKPGMISNIAGVENAWDKHGEDVTRCALRAMSHAFKDQTLRYAGTLFPGIVAVCADEFTRSKRFEEARFDRFVNTLALRTQMSWRDEISRTKGENPDMKFGNAAAFVMRATWAKANGDPMSAVAASAAEIQRVPPAAVREGLRPYAGTKWCDQCDMQISFNELSGCKSRWCTLRKLA